MSKTDDRVSRALSERGLVVASVSELVEALAVDGAGPAVDPRSVLAELRCSPRRFRVLDPVRGPWSASGGLRSTAYVHALLAHGIRLEPWVVTLEGVNDTPGARCAPFEGLSRRLSESIVWLAREVDDDSPTAVNRWCRLLREERRLNAGGVHAAIDLAPHRDAGAAL